MKNWQAGQYESENGSWISLHVNGAKIFFRALESIQHTIVNKHIIYSLLLVKHAEIFFVPLRLCRTLMLSLLDS